MGWADVVVAPVAEASKGKAPTVPWHCEYCQREFTNESVYQGHLIGKKHLKAIEGGIRPTNATELPYHSKEQKSKTKNQKQKEIAQIEFLVGKYCKVLQDMREETISNLERKLSQSYREREDSEEGEEESNASLQSDSPNEDIQSTIYNPLKLPLDWDGKPIPYWLWKLHGLGTEYPCEICGGYVYMGRKAYDRHFQVLDAAKKSFILFISLFLGVETCPWDEVFRTGQWKVLLRNNHN